MSALIATDLTKEYGDRVALDALSIDVAAGTRTVVVGDNGSGKTTFLRLAAGLLEPTSGQVTVDGHPAGSLGARAAVSYIPDTPVLYDDLGVGEHLEYVSRMHGRRDWIDRAAMLLDRLGILDRADALPGQLSRGLRQKASIAVGLVRPFSVLLVDEPFVGLDAAGRTTFVDLLDESVADGATVVMVTHQLDQVGWADRVVVLSDGHVVEDRRPEPGEAPQDEPGHGGEPQPHADGHDRA
jgi:ABC-type multidrug transport system ATPase subunit